MKEVNILHRKVKRSPFFLRKLILLQVDCCFFFTFVVELVERFFSKLESNLWGSACWVFIPDSIGFKKERELQNFLNRLHQKFSQNKYKYYFQEK